MKAVSENLEEARRVTKDAVGGGDVPVMFDGTWQKRGHKSHNGVGTAVSLDTGLCLDFEVLSNYCLACSIHKDRGGDEEIWEAFHRPMRTKVKKLNKKAQVKMNRQARKGEGDRTIPSLRPKHLLAGRRGVGKADRR
ncbi:hypothetical protein HPB50_024460 [Hyalomma asiaticum]|uniref:Uncharacterized protein n=1 Tax=Hyalomma asiaticum TaxID=266040 RepID=A0ACB7SA15_HYAAI|nr:hypothetical protein HPB50_024460 [Hyalomma asiaticum]